MSPEALRSYIRAESERWQKVAREKKIEIEQ